MRSSCGTLPSSLTLLNQNARHQPTAPTLRGGGGGGGFGAVRFADARRAAREPSPPPLPPWPWRARPPMIKTSLLPTLAVLAAAAARLADDHGRGLLRLVRRRFLVALHRYGQSASQPTVVATAIFSNRRTKVIKCLGSFQNYLGSTCTT